MNAVKVAYSHQRPTRYRTGSYCAKAIHPDFSCWRRIGIGDTADDAMREALAYLHTDYPETRDMPVNRIGRVAHVRLENSAF